jgi:branched-subunit amino acid transport protein AzlD
VADVLRPPPYASSRRASRLLEDRLIARSRSLSRLSAASALLDHPARLNDGFAVAIAVAAVITFAPRALPSRVIEPLRSSRLASVLAMHMPAGLMLMLVVYLLRDVPHEAAAAAAATVGSALLVAVLHMWRANAVLAIFAGTSVIRAGDEPARRLIAPTPTAFHAREHESTGRGERRRSAAVRPKRQSAERRAIGPAPSHKRAPGKRRGL